MFRYKIYCTEEQTRKALGLGAPIINRKNAITRDEIPHFIEGEVPKDWTLFLIPTAEQMIGWLEEQEIYVETKVNQRTDGVTNFVYNVICGSYASLNNEVIFFDSRKEAILAAIDAALKYLENLKQ